MSNTDEPVAPHWLADEPWLTRLLGRFLSSQDKPRTNPVTRRVTAAAVPELFQFSEDTAYRWSLIEALEQEFGIFQICYEPSRPGHERYERAQLRLQTEAEPLLRAWLNRPRVDPARAVWHAAIAQHAHRFIDGGLALQAFPFAAGCDPHDVAAGFAAIGDCLDHSASLREIAARCFRGDSKFLDGRTELLTRLYGEYARAILPRPLLLTAYAPVGFERLLIIENQESFLRLADQKPVGTALLYSAGFRASAARLLSEATRFAFLAGSDADNFISRWRSPAVTAYFWGDLDFAGFGIFVALRQSLPALRAWEDGYRPMLETLLGGGGHSPEAAKKTEQRDPGHTGCELADLALLPAVRDYERFLDQEAFLPRLADATASGGTLRAYAP